MQSKLLLSVVVAAMLLIAGCVGGVGDGTTTTTATTTTTTSVPPADDILADDPAAAIAEAGSFTAVWTIRTVDAEGTVEEGTFTNYVDLRNERSLFRMGGAFATGGNSMEQFYADGTSYFRLDTGEDEPFYTLSESTFDDGNWLGASSTYSATNVEDLTYVGTETFDGVTVKRYETTDERLWWWLYGDEETRVTDFVFTVLVDGDGLVRSESWSVTVENETGESETTEWEYTVSALGSTVVDDPDWLAEAEEQGVRNGN